MEAGSLAGQWPHPAHVVLLQRTMPRGSLALRYEFGHFRESGFHESSTFTHPGTTFLYISVEQTVKFRDSQEIFWPVPFTSSCPVAEIVPKTAGTDKVSCLCWLRGTISILRALQYWRQFCGWQKAQNKFFNFFVHDIQKSR